MRTNARGIALVKEAERLRLHAYPDPATGGAPWTIGWGHTGDVKEGDKITEHQAEAILDVDLDTAERIVSTAVTAPLNENQFSALASFVFNVGPGRKDHKDGFVVLESGKQSTFLRLLNAREYALAAMQFMAWKFAAGRVLPGLVIRRAAEKALFLTPVIA